ncbi:MAG: starch synthase, partial [Gammaproteobacteria bacterium]
SLRYGTLPVVHGVGGLLDTVVDASPAAIAEGRATGFVFREPTVDALIAATRRAMAQFRAEPVTWSRLQVAGMRQDFSWRASAKAYESLYTEALAALRSADPEDS